MGDFAGEGDFVGIHEDGDAGFGKGFDEVKDFFDHFWV